MSIKGVSISSLNKRQQGLMKKHGPHHTKRHLQLMVSEMKKGKTFTASHKIAMKKIGK
tara:strand:+ start:645 stop:818 length:174 start_codon:yes stop_codon:yes gene_type:complete